MEFGDGFRHQNTYRCVYDLSLSVAKEPLKMVVNSFYTWFFCVTIRMHHSRGILKYNFTAFQLSFLRCPVIVTCLISK